MLNNLSGSARVAIADTIAPAQAGVGTLTTGWIAMTTFHELLAIIAVGVFGAGATVDAKVQQAQDNAGTGAKDVATTPIAQLVAGAGNNREAVINLRERDLDKNNGFKFVRLSITVGVAATYVAGTLLGLNPRYGSASANQNASVAQTVN